MGRHLDRGNVIVGCGYFVMGLSAALMVVATMWMAIERLGGG